MHYTQLTDKKKVEIDILLAQGLSMRKVASILGIHHSTISRYKAGIYKKRKIDINKKYEIFIKYLFDYYDRKTCSIEICIYKFKKSYFKPAAALICLHGANGEDGAMAGVLQMAQIPYSCPTLASSVLCYDKQLTKIVLAHYGVPVLESLTFDSESINKNHIISQIGFPLIVKPSRLGSSVGIAVCHNIKELDKAIESAKLSQKMEAKEE